jgi:hypothetical protein
MVHANNWIRSIKLIRRVVMVGLIAMSVLLTPALGFGNTLEAQAAPRVIQAEPNQADPVDAATIKRIQDKAEDLGDHAERDIGDTGLKNLRKLPENIPETLDLVRRQRFGEGSNAEPETTRDLSHK